MGKLVFQATLGGQVNLVGPNTASTYDINVPAVAGNMVTTGDTGTVTNTMCASSVYTAPGTIGSGTPNTGSFTSLAYSTTLTGGTGVVNLGSGQFYKDSSGNVGIGTSSPAAKLDVTGTTNFLAPNATNSGGSFRFGYGGGGYAGTMMINADNDTGGAYIAWNTGTKIGNATGTYVVNGYATKIDGQLGILKFLNTSSGTAGADITWSERMRIDSSGNVGIGTSSPGNYRLYVEQAGTSVDQGIAVGASANDSMLRIFHTGSVAGIAPSYDTTGSYVPLVFYSGGQERARIDTSGSVLLGTTAGVSSSIRLSVKSISTADIAEFRATDNDKKVIFRNASDTNVGNINVGASATAYNTSSDYRLKNTVAPMTGALAKVAALKPCIYKWNVDGSDGEGFIAHELAEVVPQCVTGEKDAVDESGNPVYQGIDTSFLVATLTAAIQEQQALITQLQADVAALKAA